MNFKFFFLFLIPAFLQGCVAEQPVLVTNTQVMNTDPVTEVVMPCRVMTDQEYLRRVSIFMPGAVVALINEERTQIFLRALNKSPPETDAKADTLILIVYPQKTNALLVFVVDGCVVSSDVSPLSIIMKLLRGEVIQGPSA